MPSLMIEVDEERLQRYRECARQLGMERPDDYAAFILRESDRDYQSREDVKRLMGNEYEEFMEALHGRQLDPLDTSRTVDVVREEMHAKLRQRLGRGE